MVGKGDSPLRPLLDEEDREAGLPDLRQRLEDEVDDLRRQPERGLVEQQDLGIGGERTPDRKLLLLAIGRALLARPRLLMLDEPSLGLAPRIVAEIFRIITEINRAGTTVLLVEQNTRRALALSRRGYVLENGRIVLVGTGHELLGHEHVKRAYLGM